MANYKKNNSSHISINYPQNDGLHAKMFTRNLKKQQKKEETLFLGKRKRRLQTKQNEWVETV